MHVLVCRVNTLHDDITDDSNMPFKPFPGIRGTNAGEDECRMNEQQSISCVNQHLAGVISRL